MEHWKKEYDEIRVPEQLKEQMEISIKKAKEEKKRMKRQNTWKRFAGVAAAAVIVLALPNTSQTAAAAMQQIPILGNLFKITTVREYVVEEERNTAQVKVPQVVAQDAEASDKAKETAETINFDIEQKTNELIEEFKTGLEEEEGYQDLYIDSSVLTDNERLFSLELVLYQGAGSGYEQHKHYTVDKTTGEALTLADLCKENYVEEISEEIKTQMRAQMAEDEMVTYWLDDSEVPEWNFDQIAENQDFYVNAEGHVVICFNEYDVAPGSMGCVEFEMPQEILAENVK